MTPNKTNMLKDFALLILGISIGTVVGYTQTEPFAKWNTMSSTGNGMSGYSEIQYHIATYPSALKAQNEYLAYLSAVEKKKSEWNAWSVPWMTEQLLNYDRAITHARIAILEGREGRAAEAEKSWINAEKSATAVGWKDPGRAHILKVVNAKESEYRTWEEKAQQSPQTRTGQ